MKKGDRVKVYSDPLTREYIEGEATLVICVNENACHWDGEIYQVWEVKFDGCPQLYSRKFSQQDIIKKEGVK